MSGTEQLRWNPLPIAANGTGKITGSRIGGFLCTATGTLTLVRNNSDGTTTTLVNAMAVTAGQWTFIPFLLGKLGGTVTLASNAAGVVGV